VYIISVENPLILVSIVLNHSIARFALPLHATCRVGCGKNFFFKAIFAFSPQKASLRLEFSQKNEFFSYNFSLFFTKDMVKSILRDCDPKFSR